MKKMLIGAFAGAFALCAQADITTVAVAAASLPTGTSFENYDSGTVIDLAKDDDGGDNGSYWCTTNATDTTLTVSNLTDYAAYGKACGVPAIDGRTTNEKYVKIDANNRVYRTAVDGASIDSATGAFSAGTQLNFEDKPLFFDSMVLFTATDGLQTSDISSEDKLVVWLYGYEDGGSDTLGTGTNLVITAGYLDAQGEPTPTNYVVSSESLAIEPNTWHRLTIKALRSNEFKVGETGETLPAVISGFQVWVDGTEVSASAGSDQAISLFPSLVRSLQTDSDDTKSIVGVAFKGNGAVDDVSFTATAPEFAQEQIAQEFTLGATLVDVDELVETVAYSVDGGTETTVYDANSLIDNLTTEAIAVGGTTLTLTATLAQEEGKEANIAFIEDNGATTNLWADAGSNTFTTNISISAQTAGSSLGLTIAAFYSDGGDEPTDEGFDGGVTGNPFHLPTDDSALNALKAQIADFGVIPAGSTISYAQAYALGVLNMETGAIEDMPTVTISFDADGHPVVTMDDTNAKKTYYTITCTLEYKDDLGVTGDFAEFDPAVTAVIGEDLTDTTASERAKRFYQVKVTITDK